MSKRLLKHILNGGIPYPCRLDFQDRSPCERKFADSKSREMHEKDFNHKRKNPKNMRNHQHQSPNYGHNSNSRAVVTYTAPAKVEDKVHFIIDFLTPVMGRCANCEDEGEILPLTGKCFLCDPVLTTLAILREEKEQKRAGVNSTPAEVAAAIDAWANEAPWMHWHGGA